MEGPRTMVLKNELLQYLCPEGGRTRPAVRRRSDTSPSAVIGPSRSEPEDDAILASRRRRGLRRAAAVVERRVGRVLALVVEDPRVGL